MFNAHLNPGAPVCAWISRHKPTPQQRESLNNFHIIQINHEYQSAEDAWNRMLAACDCLPDVILLVIEKGLMLQRFLLLAQHHDIPVIRAQMMMDRQQKRLLWTGRWERLYMRQETQLWHPDYVYR